MKGKKKKKKRNKTAKPRKVKKNIPDDRSYIVFLIILGLLSMILPLIFFSSSLENLKMNSNEIRKIELKNIDKYYNKNSLNYYEITDWKWDKETYISDYSMGRTNEECLLINDINSNSLIYKSSRKRLKLNKNRYRSLKTNFDRFSRKNVVIKGQIYKIGLEEFNKINNEKYLEYDMSKMYVLIPYAGLKNGIYGIICIAIFIVVGLVLFIKGIISYNNKGL